MPRQVSKDELARIVTSKWTGERDPYETIGFPAREDVSCPACERHRAIYANETVAVGRSPFVLQWEKKAGCEVEYVYCRECGLRHVRVDGETALHDKRPPTNLGQSSTDLD